MNLLFKCIYVYFQIIHNISKDLTEKPHSWIVLPPQFTLSRSLEVFLAVGNTILVVDMSEVQDQVKLK